MLRQYWNTCAAMCYWVTFLYQGMQNSKVSASFLIICCVSVSMSAALGATLDRNSTKESGRQLTSAHPTQIPSANSSLSNSRQAVDRLAQSSPVLHPVDDYVSRNASQTTRSKSPPSIRPYDNYDAKLRTSAAEGSNEVLNSGVGHVKVAPEGYSQNTSLMLYYHQPTTQSFTEADRKLLIQAHQQNSLSLPLLNRVQLGQKSRGEFDEQSQTHEGDSHSTLDSTLFDRSGRTSTEAAEAANLRKLNFSHGGVLSPNKASDRRQTVTGNAHNISVNTPRFGELLYNMRAREHKNPVFSGQHNWLWSTSSVNQAIGQMRAKLANIIWGPQRPDVSWENPIDILVVQMKKLMQSMQLIFDYCDVELGRQAAEGGSPVAGGFSLSPNPLDRATSVQLENEAHGETHMPLFTFSTLTTNPFFTLNTQKAEKVIVDVALAAKETLDYAFGLVDSVAERPWEIYVQKLIVNLEKETNVLHAAATNFRTLLQAARGAVRLRLSECPAFATKAERKRGIRDFWMKTTARLNSIIKYAYIACMRLPALMKLIIPRLSHSLEFCPQEDLRLTDRVVAVTELFDTILNRALSAKLYNDKLASTLKNAFPEMRPSQSTSQDGPNLRLSFDSSTDCRNTLVAIESDPSVTTNQQSFLNPLELSRPSGRIGPTADLAVQDLISNAPETYMPSFDKVPTTSLGSDGASQDERNSIDPSNVISVLSHGTAAV